MPATKTAKKTAKKTTTRRASKGRKIHATREQWLEAAVDLFRPMFKAMQTEVRKHPAYSKADTVLPKNVKVACSWPSHRGTAPRGRVIGQCWNPLVSKGLATEIFISPFLEEPTRVLDVLCHELIHAAIGTKHGHDHLFATCCKLQKLEGKPTCTTASKEFEAWAKIALRKLGRYEHRKLDATEFEIADKPKKQGTRMIKCECEGCGYIVRTTQKWVDVGIVNCPNPDCDQEGEEMEAHAPKNRGEGRPVGT